MTVVPQPGCYCEFVATECEVFRILTDQTPVAEQIDLRALRHQGQLTLIDATQALDTWHSRISDIVRGGRPLPALRQRYKT